MTKAEHTLELLVLIPLVTHCVFYHPKLKIRWFFICDLSLCSLSQSGKTIVNDEGKDMEGSGCGLVMMKLGALGADNK